LRTVLSGSASSPTARWSYPTQPVTLTLFVLVAAVASAQRPTIPEAIANGAVGGVATTPSGPVPTLRALVRDSDLIVTGFVGAARGRLSADERDVYTDYSLREVTVLYEKGSPKSLPEHPLAVLVTVLGGTVIVNGVPYTHLEKALPALEPRTRVLLLLQRADSRYVITRKYYGIFDISNGSFEPTLPAEDFVLEHRGRPVEDAIRAIQGMVTDRQ
jgi:hypothetical protein